MHKKYLHRSIEEKLNHYLKTFPVIGLTGPRQSGKSTMLQQILKKYQYVNFDDYQIIRFFHDDPNGFMKVYQNRVIFDEVQRVPELFSYIKISVDQDRQNYGKYILTGSSQFSLLKKITESLAGRIGLLSLLPFEYLEIPAQQKKASIFLGGYPENVLRNFQFNQEWYAAYLATYLEKDVREINDIGSLQDFSRLIRILASRISNVLNMAEISKELGISLPTVKRWLSILEASYIIFLLPPYYKNLGKRLIKSPKLYFYDTGLVSYLTGIQNQELFENGPMSGSLFENYIISEFKKRYFHHRQNYDLFFYRTSHQEEIDLILDFKTHLEAIEIKNTHTYRPNMLKTITKFIQKSDKGYLLYQGEKFKLPDNLNCLNYAEYFSTP